MRYESTYYKQKLEKRHEKYQLTLAGSLATVSFALIASFHSDLSNRSASRMARLLSRTINGIQNMDRTEIIIAGLVAVIVGFLTLFILDLRFGKRPIVVAYKLDEENKEVCLETKLAGSNQVKKVKYKLSEIAFSNRQMNDGINKRRFDCIEFKKDFKTIGIIFLKHPMWGNYSEEEIEANIKRIKLLTTSGMLHG